MITVPTPDSIIKRNPFDCPNCGALAQHEWESLKIETYIQGGGWRTRNSKVIQSTCLACKKESFWFPNGKLLYPEKSTAPLPHKDMPDQFHDIFQEARSIFEYSPRGAAALLRLCVQELCNIIEPKANNINDAIKRMVKNGLPAVTQKALDSVRVIGNHAIHPGTINLKDNPEIAGKLFKIVNFIVEKMISEPKEIEAFYDKEIPEKEKKNIKKRDKKSKKSKGEKDSKGTEK